MNTVTLQNPITKQFKHVPVGFSTTALLFTSWVPMFRGDWKNYFILSAVGSLLFLLCFVLVGIPLYIAFHIICGTSYNKWNIKNLMFNGYKITSLPYGVTQEMLSAKLDLDVKQFMA